jgi:hypothetical protein
MTTQDHAPAGVTGNEFLDKLLDQTAPAATQPRRGQNYNYPQRQYLKPDGTVVSLQGDPQNRAYYVDKGYRMLSETPGRDGVSEAQHYRTVEYPKLLKMQREKAALINAIRRSSEQHRDLTLETTFDDYSIEEIRDYLAQIKERTGLDINVVLPRRAKAREDARDAALLRGVETAETESIESLQVKLGSGQAFQGTGYDPMEQSRRRATRSGNPPGGAV